MSEDYIDIQELGPSYTRGALLGGALSFAASAEVVPFAALGAAAGGATRFCVESYRRSDYSLSGRFEGLESFSWENTRDMLSRK